MSLIDRLNAHVDRVARICAIGDACCRAIEALGDKKPPNIPPRERHNRGERR